MFKNSLKSNCNIQAFSVFSTIFDCYYKLPFNSYKSNINKKHFSMIVSGESL